MWTGIRSTETAYSSHSGGDGNTAGHFAGYGLSGGVLLDGGVSAFTFNGKMLKVPAGNTSTPIRLKTPITDCPGERLSGFSCTGEPFAGA